MAASVAAAPPSEDPDWAAGAQVAPRGEPGGAHGSAVDEVHFDEGDDDGPRYAIGDAGSDAGDTVDDETREYSRVESARRTRRWLVVGALVAAVGGAAWFVLARGDTGRPPERPVPARAPAVVTAPVAVTAVDAAVPVVVALDAGAPPAVSAPDAAPAAAAPAAAPDLGAPSGAPESKKGGAREPSDYDDIVTAADDRAMRGDCREAVRLYEKALAARPNGVTALVGMAYCHLDQKNAPAALRHFRAALAISPRYEDALFGMAETSKSMGDTEQAIHYYRRYLEAHPRGAKAPGARKNLQLLGASESGDAPAPGPATNPGAEPDEGQRGGTP